MFQFKVFDDIDKMNDWLEKNDNNAQVKDWKILTVGNKERFVLKLATYKNIKNLK